MVPITVGHRGPLGRLGLIAAGAGRAVGGATGTDSGPIFSLGSELIR
jgi:hypothetical protein